MNNLEVAVIQTARNTTDRFANKPELHMTKDFAPSKTVLVVNPKISYQEHMGFGGAFTEAAAYTLSQISAEKRAEVINKYFDPKDGLGYTLGRVAINSCDFALENYSYVTEGDASLLSFDMSREDKWVIPLIRDAEKAMGSNLTLLASPWSPPAFMKSNKDMNNGGYLLSKYYQSWANYFTKFLEGMERRGVSIWGVTVQNEPEAVQTWDSCIYSAKQERDFIRDYLGPTLAQTGFEDTAILMWDHNRDKLVERAINVLQDEQAARYIWGVANHWYCSEDFENLSVFHHLYPDKNILFTEGCQEGGPQPGEWFTGERYGRNIIGDFSNWSRGWLDWNLVLNEIGGPNHVANYCDAPILVDRTKDQLIYNSSYFYIGHFSRYIRPGAKRIHLAANTPKGVSAIAFRNCNETIVVVVQNELDNPHCFSLVYQGLGCEVKVPSRSITTFLWQQNQV